MRTIRTVRGQCFVRMFSYERGVALSGQAFVMENMRFNQVKGANNLDRFYPALIPTCTLLLNI